MQISLPHEILVPTSQNLYILRFHGCQDVSTPILLVALTTLLPQHRFVPWEKDNDVRLHSFCMILLWQHSSELCLWGLPSFDYLWSGNKNPFDKAPLGWMKHCIKHAGQMWFAMKEMTNSSQAMESIENTPQVFFNDLGTSWKFLYRGRIRTCLLVTRTQHHTYVCTIQSQLIIFARTYVTHLKHKVEKHFLLQFFSFLVSLISTGYSTRNTEKTGRFLRDRPCRRLVSAAPKEMVPWVFQMRRCRGLVHS